MKVTYRSTKSLPREQVLRLYRSVKWSAARRPTRLLVALKRSDSVVSAWVDGSLVGLGNAISDHGLVAYYPHLLVLPEYQGEGIGREIMKRLVKRYRGFHQHILVAESKAVGFYQACGFTRAGKTASMWIFKGTEHG